MYTYYPHTELDKVQKPLMSCTLNLLSNSWSGNGKRQKYEQHGLIHCMHVINSSVVE